MAQVVDSMVVDVEIQNKARRDYFAAAAMTGILANAEFQKQDQLQNNKNVAEWSTELSDAIIAALDKEQDE